MRSMQRGLSAAIAAADADPDSSQDIPLARRLHWKRFAVLGLAAYVVALIVGLPARFVTDWGPRWQTTGTVWNGEAVFDGAYRLTWRWAPLRSLATFAFAADVRMSGAGTDIAGSVISSGRRLRFDGLAGRSDGALLATLDPSLPFRCEVALEIDVPRLIIDGARSSAVGEVRSGAGNCTAAGAAASTLMPAVLAAMHTAPDGTTIGQLAPIGQARLHLAKGSITGGRLTVAMTPAGQAAFPFLGGFRIDTAL
jgi:hypothetical protein